MISRWLVMSEHFVKSDCLRLEKIETSYCNLHVKSFALFLEFNLLNLLNFEFINNITEWQLEAELYSVI